MEDKMKHYEAHFTACGTCGALFPHVWLDNGKGFRYGHGTFCSKPCRDKYIAKSQPPRTSPVQGVRAIQLNA